ncbi:nuclear transport factor 2 family protein [Ktedonosporobacter rubrisoli]|uniref:Nuclear transport factor 2 family protein n=1 Tax=Ktedonosporobacter rubrisoli TaxID=2509675 RepID=A0A4P6JV35_KTERU|nr:nuclear transport factor 2 family protein [Ktedonosporobacter rubrisoli]QBD79507.1 nuclear transport factor 2 family protein [Ktedonosporobacter rubrisoli]
MSKADIESVRALFAGLEEDDYEMASDCLADSFLFSGWTPRPLDKLEFLTFIQGIKEGIPGLNFHLHNIQQHDHTVTARWQLTGYQTEGFTVPLLDLPPVPHRPRSISMPTEDLELILQDEMIVSLQVKPRTGGGIAGLLSLLDISMPGT